MPKYGWLVGWLALLDISISTNAIFLFVAKKSSRGYLLIYELQCRAIHSIRAGDNMIRKKIIMPEVHEVKEMEKKLQTLQANYCSFVFSFKIHIAW